MESWAIVTIAMFALGGGSAVWGMLDSLLSHRKEMAELKLSEAAKREALCAENAELTDTIAQMQDRIAVLEIIATDPARRTADAIEALR